MLNAIFKADFNVSRECVKDPALIRRILAVYFLVIELQTYENTTFPLDSILMQPSDRFNHRGCIRL